MNSLVNKYSKLTAIFYFAFLLNLATFLPDTATAQIYDKLAESSNYFCVYLPNGNRQVATQRGDRYKIVGFATAQNNISKQIRQNNNRVKTLNRTIKKLNKQKSKGRATGNLTKKEIKAAKNFLKQGEFSTDLGVNIDDQIAQLMKARRFFEDNVSFKRVELALLRSCRSKKLPPLNSVPVTIKTFIQSRFIRPDGFEGGQLRTAAILIQPAHMFNSKERFLCINTPKGVTNIAEFTTDPCGRAGVGLNLRKQCNDELTLPDGRGIPTRRVAVLTSRGLAHSFNEGSPAHTLQRRIQYGDTYLRVNQEWKDSLVARRPTANHIDACNGVTF